VDQPSAVCRGPDRGADNPAGSIDLDIAPGSSWRPTAPTGVGNSTLESDRCSACCRLPPHVSGLGARSRAPQLNYWYLPASGAVLPLAAHTAASTVDRSVLGGDRWGLPIGSAGLRTQNRAVSGRVDDVIGNIIGAERLLAPPDRPLSRLGTTAPLIAQALSSPLMLLLDEPWTSLDSSPQSGASRRAGQPIFSTPLARQEQVPCDVRARLTPILSLPGRVVSSPTAAGRLGSATRPTVITSKTLLRPVTAPPRSTLTTIGCGVRSTGRSSHPEAPSVHAEPSRR